MWSRFSASSRFCSALVAASLALVFVLGDCAYAQYARNRPLRSPVDGVPLLAGPPPGGQWRIRRYYGLELPMVFDEELLAAGLGDSFVLVLPGLGGPRDDVVVVVDDVRAATHVRAPPIPGVGAQDVTSISYTGVIRGRRSSVVVLSVLYGMLYSRVVVDDDAWVLSSDQNGQVRVLLQPRVPGAQRRRPRR